MLLKLPLLFFLFCFTFFPGSGYSSGRYQDRLPVLSYVGIIPAELPQTSGPSFHLKKIIDNIEIAFSLAIRDSRRFNIIHDELVKKLWSSFAGRKELVENHGLTTFSRLSVSIEDDVAQVTVRFLGPNFRPYLQESETFVISKLLLLEYPAINNKIKNLVFRVINRIPVDVGVSSVQGKYITLTGGYSQGLTLGDDIDIVRVSVQSLHPVLRTWRTFDEEYLGKAKLVEVKSDISIAKLVELVTENGVEVGDGARSSDIASRLRFARRQSKEKYADSFKGLVVSPSLGKPKKIGPEERKEEETVEIPLPPGFATSEEWLSSASDSKAEESKLNAVPDTISEYLHNVADRITVSAGQWGFGYDGPGASGSRIAWYYPFNRLETRISGRITSQFNYGVGGGVVAGKLQEDKGSYLGYLGLARVYWQDNHSLLDGIIRQIMAGGQLEMTGLGVSGVGFGGYDTLLGGLFLGIGGETLLFKNNSAFTWTTEFSLTPLSIGRVGYANQIHLIRSSFGWNVQAYALQKKAPRFVALGGGLTYGKQSFFDDADSYTHITQYALYLLARINF